MITFTSHNPALQTLWNNALAGLAANCRPVHGSTEPVLIEGGPYPGIWMECAPLEGLVYAPINPAVARLNHTAFFREQFPDGQIPPYIWFNKAGSGQIQQVTSIAETAYELAMLTGDEALLRETYDAWSRWDAWLGRYRDSRQLGVCEAFCAFDTGHDNSSRFTGISHACPGEDAKRCPGDPGMPRIAPDLTATRCAGRFALANIAAALGLKSDERRWRQAADTSQQALLTYCFDPEMEFFFDRDSNGKLVKIVGDAGLRVLMEWMVDHSLFERIFTRWVTNPEAFWTPFPLPSIAANDPAFLYPPTVNCWGGPGQMLLALRAPRWLEYYGRYSELNHLMDKYLEALMKADGFAQQLDPFTGEFTSGASEYSPAMCCVLDFVSRQQGVVQQLDGLFWGCTGGDADFTLELFQKRGTATASRRDGVSTLSLNGREVARITGSGRFLTNSKNTPWYYYSIQDEEVTIIIPGRLPLQVRQKANERLYLMA